MAKKNKKKEDTKVAFKGKVWLYPVSGGDGSVSFVLLNNQKDFNELDEKAPYVGKEAFSENDSHPITLKFNKSGKLLNPDTKYLKDIRVKAEQLDIELQNSDPDFGSMGDRDD